MRFYRGVPYLVSDTLAVNGRHPHALAPYFVISARLSGAEAERVKLHEWWHVVLSWAMTMPLVLAWAVWALAGQLYPVALAVFAVPALANVLRRWWPVDWQVEWEALPKGAEVAAGGDLDSEAASLADSAAYPNTRGLDYCRQRIAWWARVFGWRP